MFAQIIASMVSLPLRPAKLKELNPWSLLEEVNGCEFRFPSFIFPEGSMR